MTTENKPVTASYATWTNGKILLLSEEDASKIVTQISKTCSDQVIASKTREIVSVYGGGILGMLSGSFGSPKEVSNMLIKAEIPSKDGRKQCVVRFPVMMKGLVEFVALLCKRIGIPNLDDVTTYESDEAGEMIDIIRSMIVEEEDAKN